MLRHANMLAKLSLSMALIAALASSCVFAGCSFDSANATQNVPAPNFSHTLTDTDRLSICYELDLRMQKAWGSLGDGTIKEPLAQAINQYFQDFLGQDASSAGIDKNSLAVWMLQGALWDVVSISEAPTPSLNSAGQGAVKTEPIAPDHPEAQLEIRITIRDPKAIFAYMSADQAKKTNPTQGFLSRSFEEALASTNTTTEINTQLLCSLKGWNWQLEDNLDEILVAQLASSLHR